MPAKTHPLTDGKYAAGIAENWNTICDQVWRDTFTPQNERCKLTFRQLAKAKGMLTEEQKTAIELSVGRVKNALEAANQLRLPWAVVTAVLRDLRKAGRALQPEAADVKTKLETIERRLVAELERRTEKAKARQAMTLEEIGQALKTTREHLTSDLIRTAASAPHGAAGKVVAITVKKDWTQEDEAVQSDNTQELSESQE